jgi:hypothetical protein
MRPVPPDAATLGEIVIRSNTVMKCYLHNLDATARAFEGGWFHTGDLGVVRPDGYIEIEDRAKDIVISGGENIWTVEVKSVLYRHLDVLEAAVLARPDAVWGETPRAFVTLKEGRNVQAQSIIEFCRANLARFKVPRTVFFSEPPETATGKIQKYMLCGQASGLPSNGEPDEAALFGRKRKQEGAACAVGEAELVSPTALAVKQALNGDVQTVKTGPLAVSDRFCGGRRSGCMRAIMGMQARTQSIISRIFANVGRSWTFRSAPLCVTAGHRHGPYCRSSSPRFRPRGARASADRWDERLRA